MDRSLFEQVGRVIAPSLGFYHPQPLEPGWPIFEKMCKGDPGLRAKLEAAAAKRAADTKARLRATRAKLAAAERSRRGAPPEGPTGP